MSKYKLTNGMRVTSSRLTSSIKYYQYQERNPPFILSAKFVASLKLLLHFYALRIYSNIQKIAGVKISQSKGYFTVHRKQIQYDATYIHFRKLIHIMSNYESCDKWFGSNVYNCINCMISRIRKARSGRQV